MKYYALRRISDGKFFEGNVYPGGGGVDQVYGSLTPSKLRRYIACFDYQVDSGNHEVVEVEVRIVGLVK